MGLSSESSGPRCQSAVSASLRPPTSCLLSRLFAVYTLNSPQPRQPYRPSSEKRLLGTFQRTLRIYCYVLGALLDRKWHFAC